jgi:hypothetical protein
LLARRDIRSAMVWENNGVDNRDFFSVDTHVISVILVFSDSSICSSL